MMNILFSSDNNYVRHLGVAIYSILCHNKRISNFKFYVVDNEISSENRSKLQSLIQNFNNAELVFIPFKNWSDSLHLNMVWPISISAYARLFISEMIENDVDRVLYLDSDVLVNGDLYDLWNTNLHENVVGAVQDQVPPKTKNGVRLSSNDPYFNSGILLIDLKKWRKFDMTNESMQFISSHGGRVIHHDQGVLNGILKGKWERLPLHYNVMTIHYMMPQAKIKKFFHDDSLFYIDEEIADAKHNPVILHFTPSFTTHPWEENCKHPWANAYRETLAKTPWSGYPLEKEKNPWYLKLINWYYRNSQIF